VISWLEAAVLGVVQGLTEFLPISSSAHLLIVSQVFGWEDPGAAFTAVTQIGTESAVIIYFRHDIWRIISAWTRSLVNPALRANPDARMGWFVILGTIPIGVLGLTFADQIETVARNLWLVASMMIALAIVLFIADTRGRKNRTLDRLTLPHAVAFGFAQAAALIPGVSRSGGTITAGLLLGYTREAATRYSFLLAIPAVLISGLYEATKIGSGPAPAWGPTILATVIAFGIGYAVIAWLIRYVSTKTFLPFVIYRVTLGTLLLLLLAAGVLTA